MSGIMAGRTIILVAVVAASLAGCAVGPNYRRPPVAVPDQYYAERATAEAQSLADLPWWRLFDDPLLVNLIDQALTHGFDAQIAAARVDEARARYGVARSQFFPQVDYQAGFQRAKRDQITDPTRSTRNAWSLEAGLNWELDLWGRIRRLNESAKAGYLATEDARRGVMLSLVSDVATAYFELRELDVELEIARRTRQAFQGTYDLFSRRLEGGAASGLETSRAEASLETVAAQIPELERAIVAKENQLNFLLGRNPQPIPRESPLPPLPPAVPAGLPPQLLERRPDVREAEQSLIASNANVGVAVANFFPALSLTGLLGVVSPELNTLFTNSSTWSVAAGLVGPLFHGGQLKSEYEASKAQWRQVTVQYEATVTNALGEVSTAAMQTRLRPGAPRSPDAPPRERDHDVWAADIHLTPNDRFLYTSERTSSVLSAYGVDKATGRLAWLGATPTEKQPRGFAIDPGGRFLVCSGEKSATVSVHAIGDDGSLGAARQYPGGRGGNWVEIVAF